MSEHPPPSVPPSKRPRKQGAKPLPSFLEELPKYMTYNTTELKNGQVQEYFRIEGHPKLGKVLSSSKSMNIPIQEKYMDMLNKLSRLENDTYLPKTYEFLKGITCRNYDDSKLLLILTLLQNGQRYHMKMVCNPHLTESENMEVFMERIHSRFPELVIEPR